METKMLIAFFKDREKKSNLKAEGKKKRR